MSDSSERTLLFRQDDLERTTQTLIDMSVATNLMIFELSEQDSRMVYRDPLPGGTTKVNIERVRDREVKRFRSIARQFPFSWPLHEQGAYILRAYSGLQIFPDANHRTGLAISRVHLRLHDHVLHASSQEWKKLVEDLKKQHGPYFSRCNAGAIVNRNACFNHVAGFYASHVRPRSLLDRIMERLTRQRSQPEEYAYLSDEDIATETARKRIMLDSDGEELRD